MLEITVTRPDMWDEKKEEFIDGKSWVLKLEHSLVSLSKWESKWHVPFMSNKTKSTEQIIDYIKMMTLNKTSSEELYDYISPENFEEINRYIENPMTATTFSKTDEHSGREQVTAEIIYYWMIVLNIPFECRKWHLNRLLTLIKVCNIKNSPGKKMSKRDLADRYRSINETNRKRFNSKG